MTDIILESISDGVFTVDREWRITSFNKAAERITGMIRTDAIGKLCHEVFKSNMCSDECPLRKTMKSGNPIIDKKGWCLTPKGARVPISVSTALLVDAEGTVRGGAETFRDLREIERLKEKLEAKVIEQSFSSRNQKMQAILTQLPAIAEAPVTVLITGETGTGKEVLARAIHRLSPQAGGPFIAVNSGALPDTLLESELFGYRKGAFTGAKEHKAGRFKLAENGTLFLDEIGDISPALQVKLLRVLQEKEYEPLGATATEKTNARIICATNRDLKTMVDRGEFRQDLYYRINVITLSLPPLRERQEDIPTLAEHFLRLYGKKARKTVTSFSSEVYSAFYRYPWPGNIRELENVVERAVVLCDSREVTTPLLPEDFLDTAPNDKQLAEHESSVPPHISSPTIRGTSLKNADIRSHKRGAEKEAIISALEKAGFKTSRAAMDLGIDRATLYRKMKAYGIPTGTGK